MREKCSCACVGICKLAANQRAASLPAGTERRRNEPAGSLRARVCFVGDAAVAMAWLQEASGTSAYPSPLTSHPRISD
jgi:hypothetical protein